jgi:hypothetical protein
VEDITNEDTISMEATNWIEGLANENLDERDRVTADEEKMLDITFTRDADWGWANWHIYSNLSWRKADIRIERIQNWEKRPLLQPRKEFLHGERQWRLKWTGVQSLHDLALDCFVSTTYVYEDKGFREKLLRITGRFDRMQESGMHMGQMKKDWQEGKISGADYWLAVRRQRGVVFSDYPEKKIFTWRWRMRELFKNRDKTVTFYGYERIFNSVEIGVPIEVEWIGDGLQYRAEAIDSGWLEDGAQPEDVESWVVKELKDEFERKMQRERKTMRLEQAGLEDQEEKRRKIWKEYSKPGVFGEW